MTTSKALFIFLFIVCFQASYAQVDDRDWILSAAPHIGIPVNSVKQTHGISLGGHLQFEGKLASQSRYMIQLGTSVMQGKEYDTGFGYKEDYPAVGANHLRAGVKYFPTSKLFVAALVGGAYVSSRAENAFGYTYTPVLGVEFGNGRYFDASLRYDVTNAKYYRIATATFSLAYHL